MITRENVENLHLGQVLYHKTACNSDNSPLRARVNGAVKLWKTRPTHFQVPMKHGIRSCFYLTHENADEWLLEPLDKGENT